MEQREEDLPAQHSAGRDGAPPRHESEKASWSAPNPQQRWKLAVGEFIEDRYRKQFGGDPHDHYLYGPEPGSRKPSASQRDAHAPERVTDSARQAGDLVCYLMNLADGLQKWLAQGRVSAVLPQVIVELRKIAEALESGAPISPIKAIPLPPRPSGRVFSKQDDLESALDDEIPF